MERRLAAILSADVVGYTAMLARDESGTLAALEASRSLMSGLVRQHSGRIVDAVGDNVLAEFASAVDAVQCALNVQEQINARAAADGSPDAKGPAMRFRIGITVGDIVVMGDRIAGDGVNLAARIESQAEPGGVAVSGAVLEQVEGKLPVRFDDKGDFTLKNVQRPVHIYFVSQGEEEASSAQPAAVSDDVHVPGFGGRGAIAVLPFRNSGGSTDDEYFVDGLTDDLVTMLGSLREYPVISRNSTFAYKGKVVDPRQVGQDLQAHYIVTGSVRRAGDRLRVNAELVHTHDGREIWSGRYDREMRDVFELQDEITVAIAAAVAPALSHSERLHAIRRPPQNLDAWECVHRGMWHLFRYTLKGTKKARKWALQALSLQHDSVSAHCLVAFSWMNEVIYHWVKEREEPLQEAMRSAERAFAIDSQDALALCALGFAYSLMGNNERAKSLLERAVVHNPSSALAWWGLGTAMSASARPDDGIPLVEKAMRLSPQDPLLHEFNYTIASAHFQARRYPQAVEFARRSLELKPEQPGALQVLAAALALEGNAEEARTAVAQLVKLTPELSEERLREYLNEASVEHRLEGLRLAGWRG
ncbi:MAG: adenylate/guanylate cyclase domain-containing protein [Pseudomonadota bacterium]